MFDFKDIEITKLKITDVEELVSLLLNSGKEYSKHFIPFDFEVSTIKSLLSNARKDRYFSVRINKEIAGFFMLRGFDKGYEIPSYGVWVAEKYSGLGLSQLTLQYCISFCKINRIKKMMLKVAPENATAKHIYEKFEFRQKGIDPRIGHLIYYKEL